METKRSYKKTDLDKYVEDNEIELIGEYEKAHKDFEKSITIDTSSTSAYYYRHKIYEKQVCRFNFTFSNR